MDKMRKRENDSRSRSPSPYERRIKRVRPMNNERGLMSRSPSPDYKRMKRVHAVKDERDRRSLSSSPYEKRIKRAPAVDDKRSRRSRSRSLDDPRTAGRQRRQESVVSEEGRYGTERRRHHHQHHRHHHYRPRRHGARSERDLGSGRLPQAPRNPPAAEAELPYASRQLIKSDLGAFRPLLARYLEVQKNKLMVELDEREVRGRWKSFVRKWNEGGLARSWYDPEMYMEAVRQGAQDEGWLKPASLAAAAAAADDDAEAETEEDDGGAVEGSGDDEDDDYGPTLPGQRSLKGASAGGVARHGPGIPSLQDLAVRREMNEEDRLERAAQLRLERKAERTEQKALLEELVPRADAGTRERKLEKKAEVNDKMKKFREGSPGAAEVNDNELMGGGDSVAELKRLKQSQERKKTEREVRREEFNRARMAEREERLREYHEKEEKSMAVFRELARQRFG